MKNYRVRVYINCVTIEFLSIYAASADDAILVAKGLLNTDKKISCTETQVVDN